MTPGLQVILAVCALAITIVTILVKFGGERGVGLHRLTAIEKEVEALRVMKHAIPNLQQVDIALSDRVDRLERHVFNGTARS